MVYLIHNKRREVNNMTTNIKNLSMKDRFKAVGKVALFTVGYPVFYLMKLGVEIEQRDFSFRNFHYEEVLDFVQAYKFILGFNIEDDSVKRADYRRKCLAKKHKVDYEVYLEAHKRFYSANVTKNRIYYLSDWISFELKQLGKNEFSISYEEYGYSNKRKDVQKSGLTKAEVIEVIKQLEK